MNDLDRLESLVRAGAVSQDVTVDLITELRHLRSTLEATAALAEVMGYLHNLLIDAHNNRHKKDAFKLYNHKRKQFQAVIAFIKEHSTDEVMG